MWNQLFKITAATLLWTRYKHLIVSTLCLFGFFWLVSLLHDDFLAYSEIEGSGEFLGASFLLKWLIWLVAIGVYLFYHHRRSEKAFKQSLPTKQGIPSAETPALKANRGDPFAEIRQKNKLQSRADFIIEKKRHWPEEREKP